MDTYIVKSVNILLELCSATIRCSLISSSLFPEHLTSFLETLVHHKSAKFFTQNDLHFNYVTNHHPP